MRIVNPAVEYVAKSRWMLARALHTALQTGIPATELAEVADMTVDQVLGLADCFANG